MEKLPNNLSEKDFLELAELHKKYEEACDQVRYHKKNRAAVSVVVSLTKTMKERLKECNDFKPTPSDETDTDTDAEIDADIETTPPGAINPVLKDIALVGAVAVFLCWLSTWFT